MKSTHRTILLVILVLTMFALTLTAQVLPRDLNGTPVQLTRYFTTVSDTIPIQAPTVVDSIAVPTNAGEVIIVARHQALYIRPNATTTTTGVAASWVYVPKDAIYRFPVMDAEYICYRSTTGAAKINITWLRM